MKAALRTASVLVACALAIAGCSRTPLEQARDGAVQYFGTRISGVDVTWGALFDYYHRRFGLEVSDPEGHALHELLEREPRTPLDRIYQRIQDPSVVVMPSAIAALPSPVDRITAAALHCDRLPLPPEWLDILKKATEAGRYALTHATLAGQWTLENGCRPAPPLLSLQRRQVEALVALVEDQRRAFHGQETNALDLWIEALAMLYYVGAGARVPPDAIPKLLGAQRPDGGWPAHPRALSSDPHATALALWSVLENLDPTAPPITWIPRSNIPRPPSESTSG